MKPQNDHQPKMKYFTQMPLCMQNEYCSTWVRHADSRLCGLRKDFKHSFSEIQNTGITQGKQKPSPGRKIDFTTLGNLCLERFFSSKIKQLIKP